MKTNLAIVVLVLAAMSATEAGSMKKRFLINTDIYNSAKDTFNSVVPGINFDAAVNALIPYIHSDMTVFACTTICVGAAASVLGPAAALAGIACPPLCEGALAKLEEMAG